MPIARVVAIGASAGGVSALERVVASLPADFPAPIFVVLHTAPYRASALPEVLSRAGPLPAEHARDGAEFGPGRIYIAPPDHHLLIERGRVAVTRGPKENRFRPSIDALFRSAGYTYDGGAIGVVLSGALDDGTAGLWIIKRFGGVSIIQDPGEALFDSMPLNAVNEVVVDHVLPASEIGPQLAAIVREPAPAGASVDTTLRERARVELRVAAADLDAAEHMLNYGEPTRYTCPECHGALQRIDDRDVVRFRCHTGHAFTAGALVSGLSHSIDTTLASAVRAVHEAALLFDEMSDRYRAMSRPDEAALAAARAEAARDTARRLHQMAEASLTGQPLASAEA